MDWNIGTVYLDYYDDQNHDDDDDEYNNDYDDN